MHHLLTPPTTVPCTPDPPTTVPCITYLPTSVPCTPDPPTTVPCITYLPLPQLHASLAPPTTVPCITYPARPSHPSPAAAGGGHPPRQIHLCNAHWGGLGALPLLLQARAPCERTDRDLRHKHDGACESSRLCFVVCTTDLQCVHSKKVHSKKVKCHGHMM